MMLLIQEIYPTGSLTVPKICNRLNLKAILVIVHLNLLNLQAKESVSFFHTVDDAHLLSLQSEVLKYH